MLLRQRVDAPEARIVARSGILRAGIAQANDDEAGWFSTRNGLAAEGLEEVEHRRRVGGTEGCQSLDDGMLFLV